MTSPFSFTCGPTQDLRVVATGKTGAMGVSIETIFFLNSLWNLINILYEIRCQGVYFFNLMSFANAFLQFDSLFSSKQLDLQLRLKQSLGIRYHRTGCRMKVLVEKHANHLPNRAERKNII